MRISFAIIVLFLAALNLAAQTEITEKQFNEVNAKGAELLSSSSYRSTRKLEYFEDRSKPGRASETSLKEVLIPDQWRTVEEKFYDKPTREERIWDGKFLYVKVNDGEWKRYNGGGSGGVDIETGQRITKSYKYLGKAALDNKQADLYENTIDRIARKMTVSDTFTVHYIRRTRYWFAIDGKLLKKLVENEIEGRNELSREITTVDYDANIKIEAPIK